MIPLRLVASAFALTATLASAAASVAAQTPNARPVDAAPAPGVSADYRIHPGDQLNVQVYGDQSLTQTVTVLSDGSVQYPLIGRVQVGGKSPADASAAISSKLAAFIKHPIVTVGVAQQGQENVLVLGNVKTPGKYALRAGAHVTDALAAAGGLGPTDGEYPKARVTQPDGSVATVSLQQLLQSGASSQNVGIGDNAVVYVEGKNTFLVQVVGAVDRPGGIELSDGDRLSTAIARAGSSPNVYSDLNHVVVTHSNADGSTVKHEVNMYKALQDGDRSADPVLAKGDVVYVPMGRRPSQINPFGLLGRLIGL